MLDGLDLNLSFGLYDWDIFEVFGIIEESTIRVDLDLFVRRHKLTQASLSLVNDQLYSVYSLDNLTARPSNSFNGLNLMSLRKDKESRECFLPNNDVFVEFDYDAFHLRLIADQFGYKIGGKRAHEEFARLYFNKKEISEADYKAAKKLTFKMLYSGDIDQKYLVVPFFKKVKELVPKMWKKYQRKGYVVCPKSGRKIQNVPEPTPYKVFSYWAQCLETSENILLLKDLLVLLEGRVSKIVLYQFDSILVDLSKAEVYLVEAIRHRMGKKFPVNVGTYSTFPF